jgi:hypothetical protein
MRRIDIFAFPGCSGPVTVNEIGTADAGETAMRYEPFRNLFVTPVLPFGDDGAIDEPAYRAFLRAFSPRPPSGRAWP